ncbi:adenylosuccinate synthetase [Ignicoccus hospitalis]|uniref:Adenylosuccinate synthetase n=1 Tax=Ignicoccus hospitalis (strain KIN4/I / DSM 18386 / JCM 14125) TaxID=453591 RepID=A8A9C7_IGNH4|nr:adenylosuccinate synthetase [Ignicoccus hospitalis]ABU81529.1 Adenylosuccinate synthetase [Ignicoccus hospitalis KIN4/I]HIH90464.1 adenylosuccinate synthetase [Desulfurococcaceae archaeon]
MPVRLVVGALFGDEGKGKVAAYLSFVERPEFLVRTGAINAGHTVVHMGKEYKLRALPSGTVTCDVCKAAVAPGALISVGVLANEVKELGISKERVFVDENTGIIEEEHVRREREDAHLRSRIGSTLTGVGAAMSDRVMRRLKLARDFKEEIEKYATVTDVPSLLYDAVDSYKVVHVEGTQGFGLSLFHGTYPYVTSRDVTAGALLSETGLAPSDVEDVILVTKSFVTRVGEGPLKGELSLEELQRRGMVERGTVTGRPRRAAPLEENLDLLKRAARANGATKIAITKIDVLFPKAKGVTSWSDLPPEARLWISDIEKEVGVPVCYVGTGPEALETVGVC